MLKRPIRLLLRSLPIVFSCVGVVVRASDDEGAVEVVEVVDEDVEDVEELEDVDVDEEVIVDVEETSTVQASPDVVTSFVFPDFPTLGTCQIYVVSMHALYGLVLEGVAWMV
jgi:hypothetical protein